MIQLRQYRGISVPGVLQRYWNGTAARWWRAGIDAAYAAAYADQMERRRRDNSHGR